MKTKKTFLVITALLLLVGVGNEIIAAQKGKNSKTATKVASKTKGTSTKNNQSEAGKIAEDFINSYISGNFNIDNSPTTVKFKQEFKNRSEALDLAERLLNGEKLTKAQENFIEKYPGIEYDVIFSGAIHDIIPEHSNFKMIGYNKNTGVVSLRDTIEPIFGFNPDS